MRNLHTSKRMVNKDSSERGMWVSDDDDDSFGRVSFHLTRRYQIT